MFTRRLLVVAAVPLVVAGCGSGAKNVAFHPSSAHPSSAPATSASPETGDRVVGPGVLSSVTFIPDLQMTLPSGGWGFHEDANGYQLELAAPGHPDQTIRMYITMGPVRPDGSIVRSVKNTPAGLAAALRHEGALTVTAPVVRRVAGSVAATSLDLGIRGSASKREVLAYAGDFGSAMLTLTRGTRTRVYFVAVTSAGGRDTLVVSVQAPASEFAGFAKIAAGVLASLKFPEAYHAV
jgi:hypothetical protein